MNRGAPRAEESLFSFDGNVERFPSRRINWRLIAYCTLTVIAVVCAVPVDGVAVTVKVYVPVVVPGFVTPPPAPEPPPLQLIPAAATTASNTTSGTNFQRRWLGTISKKKIPAREIATPAKGQTRPEGRLDGPGTMCAAAVVAQVIVALPVSEVVVRVIVPGAVKFWSGAPKVQVGISVALGGVILTAELNVIVPEKPPDPDTVIKSVPDWPGAPTVITPLLAGFKLKVAPFVTVTVTPLEVEAE
jgi:hypothetical protein